MTISKGWQQFLENCQAMPNLDDLNSFFDLTLTPAEREKIGLRYLILLELVKANKSQREIAASLGVSIFNVTRGANQLKAVTSNVEQLLLK